jgi:histidinol-phosphate/aromatic aminotransferase/cobyric acid decarboxylase-like protein
VADKAPGTLRLSFRFEPAGIPTGSDQERKLRLVSRYPQGISEDLLQALLARYGQAEPDTVTAPR